MEIGCKFSRRFAEGHPASNHRLGGCRAAVARMNILAFSLRRSCHFEGADHLPLGGAGEGPGGVREVLALELREAVVDAARCDRLVEVRPIFFKTPS